MATVGTKMSGHLQSQLTRSLERLLEEAHLSGELKLTGRKLKDFPNVGEKCNLSDTVIAGTCLSFTQGVSPARSLWYNAGFSQWEGMSILGLEQAFDLVFYKLGIYLLICTHCNLDYYSSCILFIEIRQDPIGIN
jgi:hypothetical protein